MIWDLYQQYQINQLDQKLDRINDNVASDRAVARAAAQLEDKVNRLALLCRAMFELMQQTTGVSEDQLKAKVVEIDLRDGQADGRMTATPKKCPKCGAMIAPRFGRCLFCGYQDEASAASVI